MEFGVGFGWRPKLDGLVSGFQVLIWIIAGVAAVYQGMQLFNILWILQQEFWNLPAYFTFSTCPHILLLIGFLPNFFYLLD